MAYCLKLPVSVTNAVDQNKDPALIEQIMAEELARIIPSIDGQYTPSHFWSSLITTAVVCGNLGLLEYLVDKGYDLNIRLERTWWPLPLHVALWEKKDPTFIRILLNAGASVHIVARCTVSEPSQYHLAITIPLLTDDSDMLELIIPYFDPAQIKFQFELLHEACRHKAMKCVQLLLIRGYQDNINRKDEIGKTPLMYTVRHEPTIVQMLLKNGADANIRDKSNATALHMVFNRNALDDDTTEVMRLLLRAGADANAQYKGRVPLSMICRISVPYYAKAEHGVTILKMLDILINYGANINLGNENLMYVTTTILNKVYRHLLYLDVSDYVFDPNCVVSGFNLIKGIYEKCLEAGGVNMVNENGQCMVDILLNEFPFCYGLFRKWIGESEYKLLVYNLVKLLEKHFNYGGRLPEDIYLVCNVYLLEPSVHRTILTIMWQSLHDGTFRRNIHHLSIASFEKDNAKIKEKNTTRGLEDLIEQYLTEPRTLLEISRSLIFSSLRPPQKETVLYLPGPATLASQILCSSDNKRY